MERLKELQLEANRCLGCKNARCSNKCPINTPIPQVIELFKDGKVEEAGEILFENNPLSLVCSIVCPHERQCYGNCIRGIKGDSVNFYEIERYISGKYLENFSLKLDKKLDSKVAIVGGGPAGISVAFNLALKGYDVTIFEKNQKLGGVLRYGIPNFRLDKSIIDLIEEKLIQLGVKIRNNISVLDNIKLEDLFRDGYDAVFLGIGLEEAKAIKMKGETRHNVHYAIDYLKAPDSIDLGNNVGIIGAGNVAMDAARTVRKTGANTTVYYRRDFSDMTAVLAEINDAREEGVQFKVFESPVEIVDEGLITISTKKVEDNESKIVNIEGSEKLNKLDSIIIAVSQQAKEYSQEGLDFNQWRLLEVDENGQTSMEGVFAAGDIVSGAKTVVEAVNNSKIVAENIHKYINNKQNNVHRA
ncbi:TPA: NAD(P)-dependent oxidoreductase [Clostridium perfringens]|uniref:FAD-dependent oxidoreductase n=1 Tax=Clostridium perfringens TaxID=1502 RepID=A0AAW9HZM8_CLOPF|nr:NAD(P)-dependent oxidoreductase [Clostridium perfringens]EGT3603345.1 NAD(P)-dependent oxidoreductase [Clostridium perfringens]EHA6439758.1 NAD(P)-dependent oxidoreductase [Clostridium perfringens]EHK2399189.1 NAD(P)-dependent oxidoreductase [Clostridium perfringens]EJT5918250.1 NAD(P)-dependent oxidoreductase [Clostridium perfringens]EJT5926602.1 NAD(P)-dependent oxidoreductase [Clostridium perfringens]